MKFLYILIIFMTASVCANDRDRAISSIQRAVLSYPEVKKIKKQIEVGIVKRIPMDKESIGVVGGVALSISRGYVDTKVIKKMDVRTMGGTLRPNIRYDFKRKSTRSTVDINWNF